MHMTGCIILPGLACSPHPPRASPLFAAGLAWARCIDGRSHQSLRWAIYLAALDHVLTPYEEHLVAAGAADQDVSCVVVGDAVGPAADDVVARAAVDPVLAVAALDLVVALTAEDPVRAALALERVHAAQAVERVGAVQGEHPVVVGAAVHGVGLVRARAIAAGAVDGPRVCDAHDQEDRRHHDRGHEYRSSHASLPLVRRMSYCGGGLSISQLSRTTSWPGVKYAVSTPSPQSRTSRTPSFGRSGVPALTRSSPGPP